MHCFGVLPRHCHLLHRFLKELGHLQLYLHVGAHLLEGGRTVVLSLHDHNGHCALTSPLHHYLGRNTLEGRGQGIGEEPEVDWEEELHEGDDDEDREGNHSKDVSSRPAKLDIKREGGRGGVIGSLYQLTLLTTTSKGYIVCFKEAHR